MPNSHHSWSRSIQTSPTCKTKWTARYQLLVLGAPTPISYLKATGQRITKRTRHIGDTYTSTDKTGVNMGKSWRYTTHFTWQEIHDTLISQALPYHSPAHSGQQEYYFYPSPLSTKRATRGYWKASKQLTAGNTKLVPYYTPLSQAPHSCKLIGWINSKLAVLPELRDSEAKSKQAWESYANSKGAPSAETKAKAHADGKVTAEEAGTYNSSTAGSRYSQGTRRSTRSTAENTNGSLCRQRSHRSQSEPLR